MKAVSGKDLSRVLEQARMVAAPHPREPPHLWKSRKYCAAVRARPRQQAYQSGVAQTSPSVRWFVRIRPLISNPGQGDSGSEKFPRNFFTRPESFRADDRAVSMQNHVAGIGPENGFCPRGALSDPIFYCEYVVRGATRPPSITTTWSAHCTADGLCEINTTVIVPRSCWRA